MTLAATISPRPSINVMVIALLKEIPGARSRRRLNRRERVAPRLMMTPRRFDCLEEPFLSSPAHHGHYGGEREAKRNP